MGTTARPALNVRVMLFAGYADSLGLDRLDLNLNPGATVGEAVDRLRALPGGELLPRKPLCALNLKHVGPDVPLTDGDELALLPPLAGG